MYGTKVGSLNGDSLRWDLDHEQSINSMFYCPFAASPNLFQDLGVQVTDKEGSIAFAPAPCLLENIGVCCILCFSLSFPD